MYMSGVQSIASLRAAATTDHRAPSPLTNSESPSTGSTARSAAYSPEAKLVYHAQDARTALEPTHPPLLVGALLPQDSHPARHRNLAQAFAKRLRGERVCLLWSPGTYRRGDLQSYLLRDGGVLDGLGPQRPRAEPGCVDTLSPILSRPFAHDQVRIKAGSYQIDTKLFPRSATGVSHGSSCLEFHYTPIAPCPPPPPATLRARRRSALSSPSARGSLSQ